MELRDNQLNLIGKVRDEIRKGRRRILIQACTGFGKTVVASHIMNASSDNHKHSLFIAHRREIIHQTSEKLSRFDCPHGIILAGERKKIYPYAQVASIQTFHSRIVRGGSQKPPADVVFIDEAHRSIAKTYQESAALYPDAIFIGMTATPVRSDGRGLGGFWDSLVEAASIEELIEQGYLVRPKYYAPSIPDLTNVRTRAGDYVKEDLEDALNKQRLVGDIVLDWKERCSGRQTVVFASGVAHSKHITEQFLRTGINAAHIDGTTEKDERDDILQSLERGDIQVVCNSDVLLEGWDCPPISCAVLARPTKSYGLYLQMAGRVVRACEGKEDTVLLDHSGGVYRHGFIEDAGGWSLDPDKKISEIRLEKNEEKDGMVTCRECFTVYESSDHCPSCGWMPTKQAKAINMQEGRLLEVRRAKPKRDNRQDEWNNAMWVCIKTNRKIGAAAHIYKNKMNEWPNGLKGVPQCRADWQLPAKVFYETRVHKTA